MNRARLANPRRIATAACLAGLAATPAQAAVALRLFDQGFSAPVFLAGIANSVYVVEQGGRIVSVNRSSKARSTFFTVPDIETGGEKGLLGLAFDPAFRGNGRFYVNVTTRVNGQLVSEIRRYTDPAIATEAPAVLLRVNQPFDNHNGGWLAFGADKNLYIAFGDGGSANDPLNLAQNQASLLGKILRIDVRGDGFPADPLRNYRIPAGNPFGTEILAYGLRNPFRASIDRPTGDLWIGDVGQGAFEEIDRIPGGTSGQNFGWRPLEANIPTPGIGDPIPPGTTAPVFAYSHASGDRSITGGVVQRGGLVAELLDRYVFADFVSGRLWSIALDGTGLSEFTAAAAPFGGGNWSAITRDGGSGLYAIDYGGRIFTVTGTRPGAGLTATAGLAATSAPEPASWALLIAGFGLVGAARRLQRTRQAG